MTDIPTKAKFQSATSVIFAGSLPRQADTILLSIDRLLDDFHKSEPNGLERMLCLAKLWRAADLWLKQAGEVRGSVNQGRKPAVAAFYQKIVQRLSEETRVPVNLLPDWLADTFGKSMTAHGVHVDYDFKRTDVYTPQELEKFRLIFRGGVAYMQEWWLTKLWIPADTRLIQLGFRPDIITRGYAGYVVTLGGQFYSTLHWPSSQYHSSYLGGEAILCAGEIKIHTGAVVAINNSSGHYAPNNVKLRDAVELLAMMSVNMETLTVTAHGMTALKGLDYLEHVKPNYEDVRTRYQPGRDVTSERQTADVWANYARVELRQRAAESLFKRHWKPKGQSDVAHGATPEALTACPECLEYRVFWEPFRKSAWRVGLDRAEIPKAIPKSDQTRPASEIMAEAKATIALYPIWSYGEAPIPLDELTRLLTEELSLELSQFKHLLVIPYAMAKTYNRDVDFDREFAKRFNIDYFVNGELQGMLGEQVSLQLMSVNEKTRPIDIEFEITPANFRSKVKPAAKEIVTHLRKILVNYYFSNR